ncbi:MAG TPA: hypothetical protein VFZ27_08295 [Terriglobia bacterium]|nr:hypothetical protein [Terriglobia bacterium]
MTSEVIFPLIRIRAADRNAGGLRYATELCWSQRLQINICASRERESDQSRRVKEQLCATRCSLRLFAVVPSKTVDLTIGGSRYLTTG